MTETKIDGCCATALLSALSAILTHGGMVEIVHVCIEGHHVRITAETKRVGATLERTEYAITCGSARP